MNKKVLIVEDQFVEANDLQLMLGKAGYDVCGIARSVPIAQEMIRKEKPSLVLLDIFLKGKLTGIDLAKQLRQDNIAFIYLSANSNEEILSVAKTTEPYGFIVKPFREKDLLVTLEIAQYRHEHSRESKYRREAELIEQLEKTITRYTDWRQNLLHIGKLIQPDIPFDFLAAGFDDPGKILNHGVCFLRIGFNEYQTIGVKELSMIAGVTTDELKAIYAASEKETSAAFFNTDLFEKIILKSPLSNLFRDTFGVMSVLTFPIQLAGGETFSFCFYSRRPDAYSAEHLAILHRLQRTLNSILDQMHVAKNTGVDADYSNKDTKQLTNDNTNANIPGFEGIIGSSHLLLTVFDQITQVAPYDTAVLILGESGTGKERIADCIHKLSPRKTKALVKVNCAALPATLIESELFGHEKGSFTGATDKRIGKFEQANGGTIFLDEIGEMPVDLQVKLLRVLQEKEIEPIGSTSSIKINVRIIAATNRNLEKEVAEGRFRLDLYYRLNVFPIELPPLRERTEDIPALAIHFINYYNRKAGKKITGLSDKVVRNMMNYRWPGNIRELENLIERGVLLAKGTVIEDMSVPATQTKDITFVNQDAHMKTIHENERDYIVTILKKCNGRIWGAGGAAEVLNVPPSTLKSKMKKLGIHKENID
ncbi:MAG: sigma 54-interacting transcriptional regulator [Chitinophagaceae bacterium]|nr:sigma 54-interacting transcriptional regulator [Chitinophagaceae bacterium]